jgi:hypothetical protein
MTRDPSTLLVQLTIGEMMEIISDVIKKHEQETRDVPVKKTPKRNVNYLYGIAEIADYMDISKMRFHEIKRTGLLDGIVEKQSPQKTRAEKDKVDAIMKEMAEHGGWRELYEFRKQVINHETSQE